MKKLFSAVMCAVLIFMMCVPAFAFEYDGGGLYKIELPNDFTELEEGKFSGKSNTKFENATFSVSYSDNTTEKFSVEESTEDELREIAEFMAQNGTNAFELANKKGSMEVVSCQKKEHPNGKSAAVIVFKTTMEGEAGEVSHLQKLYFFSGSEKTYSFSYTSAKDEDIDALDVSFDSIIITEGEPKTVKDKVIEYVILAVILLLLVLGIIRFFRRKK